MKRALLLSLLGCLLGCHHHVPPPCPPNCPIPHSVDLTWNAPIPDSGQPAIASYTVYRGPSAEGPFGWIGSTTETKFSDNNAIAGRVYWYTVSSVDASGTEGEKCQAVRAEIPKL